MGRMGRLAYSLRLFAILIIKVLFKLIFYRQPEGIIIINILLAIYFFMIAILRFHDMDKSGWWALTTLIPFVPIIIAFIPGTKGENRFLNN